jgi:hypothetical protein
MLSFGLAACLKGASLHFHLQTQQPFLYHAIILLPLMIPSRVEGKGKAKAASGLELFQSYISSVF